MTETSDFLEVRPPISIRPELKEFSEAMELILRLHDRRKKASWKTCDIHFLNSKLTEEFFEWKEEVKRIDPNSRELVDLANIAFFLWWRYTNR